VAAAVSVGALTLSSLLAMASPAGAQAATWYSGETKTVSWTVDAETGAYSLELWTTGGSPAKVATIGSGTDVTSTSYTWTIPQGLSAVVGTGLQVKVVPSGGGTWDPIVLDAVDIVTSSIDDVTVCEEEGQDPDECSETLAGYEIVAGATQHVSWDTDGVTGSLVKIELVRTVESVETTTVLVKSTANDGGETVVIPAKTTVDTAPDETYTVKVSSLTAGVGADSSTAVPVVANAASVSVSTTTAAIGEPVEITFGADFWTVAAKWDVVAKPTTTGKPVKIYSGVHPGDAFTWYPATAGTYDIVVTYKGKQKLTATSVAPVVVSANADIVTQNDPSDTTITVGQPVTVSWDFFDDENDATANAVAIPVDVTLVSAAGKVTYLAKGFYGSYTLLTNTWTTNEFTWRPSGKLAAGAYTLKVTKSGDTVSSDKTVTLAHPTSLATSDFASATAEPGEVVTVEWTVTDDAELPVNISLVPTEGKAIPLGKKVVASGNDIDVAIPATTPAGTYSLTVATLDKFGAEPAPLSASESFTITAPVLTVTAGATVKNGQELTIEWAYADDSQLPVKLELFAGAATKATAVIAKKAPTADPGAGSYTWVVPAKIAAAADYTVRATVVGIKTTPVTDDSDAVAVTAPSLAVDESNLSGGLTQGQTVDIEWTSDAGVSQSVSVVLVKGTSVVAKLATKEVTSNGAGVLSWTVPSTLAAGTDYVIRVTDNGLKTLTDDSATFTVSANETAAV
jgi:hypothetical protein